ncbi:hypothetical protein ACJ41O_008790 [Fusarium nematophilum]
MSNLDSDIQDMIDLIYWPPDGSQTDRKLPENSRYYGNWGFAIYRTYYGPHSDKYWNMLLGTPEATNQPSAWIL